MFLLYAMLGEGPRLSPVTAFAENWFHLFEFFAQVVASLMAGWSRDSLEPGWGLALRAGFDAAADKTA